MNLGASWQIWIDDDKGNRLSVLDNIAAFSVSKLANQPGVCTATLPRKYIDQIKPDTILEFWRKPAGGALALFGAYFVRRIEYADVGGRDKIIVTAYDAIELLKRRIIAYAAGSAEAQKTDYADDILYALVSEQMGVTATDTDRQLTDYLDGPGSPSAAPSITMGFAWRNLLTTMQAVCDASREAGTELYFDWTPYTRSGGGIGFHFITYVDQPGADRTSGTTSGTPVYFGREWGNMVGASLVYDYTEEVNYIYSGGPGEEANREIVEVEDASREGISVYNRREGFCDARNANSTDPTDEITDRGNAALEAGRPRVTFTGTLTDTYQFKLGVDWFFGDKVTCSHFGREFDGVIKALAINVSEAGVETIDVRVEAEL